MCFGTAIPRFESWRPSQNSLGNEALKPEDKSDIKEQTVFSAAQRPAHSVPDPSGLPIGREAENSTIIAALYVQPDGCYANLPGVEIWDQARDARTYAGPHPVVAHPPCQRWGRYWSGGPSARIKRIKGDDEGCFAAALATVRRYGGVLEHPEASHAWAAFGLKAPPRTGGWVVADFEGGWTCCVEQGHYGHRARKATWLYAFDVDLPSLLWGSCGPRDRLDAGFRSAAARRAATVTYVGKRLTKSECLSTPPAFRDVLLAMAATALAPSLSGRN